MEFWLSKYVIDAAVFLFVLVVWSIIMVKKWIFQHFCKHTEYFETRACQAVCCRCNKHLGFIGDVRKQKNRKEV